MNEQPLSEVPISLPPELERRVELAARERGVSASEFVLTALVDELARQGSELATEMQSRPRGKRS